MTEPHYLLLAKKVSERLQLKEPIPVLQHAGGCQSV